MTETSKTGRIMKQVGGFYYVETQDGRVIECRAMGIFRKDGHRPVVGDMATIQLDPGTGQGMVASLMERKNYLVRPPLANLDRMFMVVSVIDPPPNPLILDKLIAIAEVKEIEPVVVATKADLESADELLELYRSAGFLTAEISATEGRGVEAVREMIKGKICAFIGNTGVGKSSLLNAILPELALPTGEISKKLGRGRHTTRHVELYHVAGGLIADTPGFSTVDVVAYEPIFKDQLQYCFREFQPYLLACKFTGCSHTCEKGCAVLGAVERGDISPARHHSYCEMYEESKQLREWDLPT